MEIESTRLILTIFLGIITITLGSNQSVFAESYDLIIESTNPNNEIRTHNGGGVSEILTDGTWYRIATVSGDESFLKGCQPNDPSGPQCVGWPGVIMAGPPPWTFSCPSSGCVLTYTDLGDQNDRVEAFDFGISIGTSTPITDPSGVCEGDYADPNNCLLDPDTSHLVVNLSEGQHSITFQLLEGISGAMDFKVEISEMNSGGDGTATHSFEFNDDLKDSLTDLVLDNPNGGTVTSTTYVFEEGQGLQGQDFLTFNQEPPETYSVEMCLKIADNEDWRKLIDFKNLVEDEGLYVTPDDELGFYSEDYGETVIPGDTLFHVVMTRDMYTNQVVGYLDGSEEFSFTDNDELAIPELNMWYFVKDDFDTNESEETEGTINYIKIYDHVLNQNQISSKVNQCVPEEPEPEPITLTGIIRDFCDPAIEGQCIDHPDFEDPPIEGLETGVVQSTLGNDGKPVFAGSSTNMFTTAENFDQWYRDVEGVNTAKQFSITLEPESPGSDVVTYQDGSFFPIDGELFGNQGRSHNYHFTYELPATFVYQGGEYFEFCGDDDIWVFINNELVIDIGGIHGQTCRDVQLDNLGLTEGNTIDFKLFFAERHTTGSNFKAWTNIELQAEKPQVTKKTGGDNQWDTRPTFGVSHETRQGLVVENGFSFNGDYFTLTDNHHTDFAQQSVEIGTMNSFSATVYADKKLKVQEFLFGIPNVGESHLAELGIEVWYDRDGNIDDVKVVQDTPVIDEGTISVSSEMTKCLSTDPEALCVTTNVAMTFLEPLMHDVMAIKAIDWANRDQRTYLNDGFDISGDSLNPMANKMIPSNMKNQGLIKVTQVAKYSPYWQSDDGRMFEMNSFGSFKEINQTFERFQDSGNAFTRMHSGFGGILDYEQNRATQVFDSTKLISELPNSFGHHFEMTERLNEQLVSDMLEQQEIAKEILREMDKQNRHY